MQVLFSRKGLDFWDEKPTSKQSSCSCSVMYFMMSSTALLTVIRFRAASRRSCSVTRRCCCKFVITMSITAVYVQQKWKNFCANFVITKNKKKKKYTTNLKATWMSDVGALLSQIAKLGLNNSTLFFCHEKSLVDSFSVRVLCSYPQFFEDLTVSYFYLPVCQSLKQSRTWRLRRITWRDDWLTNASS